MAGRVAAAHRDHRTAGAARQEAVVRQAAGREAARAGRRAAVVQAAVQAGAAGAVQPRQAVRADRPVGRLDASVRPGEAVAAHRRDQDRQDPNHYRSSATSFLSRATRAPGAVHVLHTLACPGQPSSRNGRWAAAAGRTGAPVATGRARRPLLETRSAGMVRASDPPRP